MKYIYTLFFSLSIFFSAQSKQLKNNILKEHSTVLLREKVDYGEWKALLSMHVMTNGKVDYSGFKKDKKRLESFLNKLSKTQITPYWSKKDKIAYWINVYNAFTVKLIVDNFPISSIKDIKSPWKNEFFIINGTPMSLGDVEHKILRKFNEPRIHFAINCASNSCPRLIQIPYTSENLERLLERQTVEYINKSDANNITKSYYELSQLFSWFGKDFKSKGQSIKDFVNKYSKIKITTQPNNGFVKYDWKLNSI